MNDDATCFAIGIILGIMLGGFIAWVIWSEPGVEPGYGREFKCGKKQVVQVEYNGYTEGKPCKSVRK